VGLAVTPAESPGQKETTGPSPSSTRAVEELKKELDNQTALQESAILALSRIDNEQARAKLAEWIGRSSRLLKRPLRR
jgi:hypothetical protein